MQVRFLDLGVLRRALHARVCFAVLAAGAATACLTPDFDLGERPDDSGSDGSGGGGTGGGGGGTGGTGGTPTHCENDRKDSDETDQDCGGKSCDACADGKVCAAARDCESGVCTDLSCAVPACDDGVKNGDENGVDCGNTCDSCLGDVCDDATDCADAGAICQDNVCTKLIVQGDRATGDGDLVSSRFLTVNVSKASAPAGHRLLVVAVNALNDDEMVPTSVTFSGRQLSTLESDTAGHDWSIVRGTFLFAGIYVLYECDIAKATTDSVLVEMPKADYETVEVDAILFGNANQVLDDLARSAMVDFQSITLSAENALAEQSWFVGGAVNRTYPWIVDKPTSPDGDSSTFFDPEFRVTKGVVTVWKELPAGNATFQWKSDYQEKAAAGLILKPAAAPAAACP